MISMGRYFLIIVKFEYIQKGKYRSVSNTNIIENPPKFILHGPLMRRLLRRKTLQLTRGGGGLNDFDPIQNFRRLFCTDGLMGRGGLKILWGGFKPRAPYFYTYGEDLHQSGGHFVVALRDCNITNI